MKKVVYAIALAIVLKVIAVSLIYFFVFFGGLDYIRYFNVPFVTTKDAQQISEAYTINEKADLERFSKKFPLNKNYKFSVNVDTITYSSDSLLCVALLIMSHNRKELKEDWGDSTEYEGIAVIGCRDSINSPFQIYPFDMLEVTTNGIHLVRKYMRQFYFTDIAGKGAPTGTNLQGETYTCGIGDPKFFIEAPNFKRNKYNGYKFKYYLEKGDEIPYDLPSNKQLADSTRHANLVEQPR